ncbi:MAG: hypothetical protein WAS55_13335 [Saprospiraceae bacterium]
MKQNLHNVIFILIFFIGQSSCKTLTSETIIILDLTEETFTHISINEYKIISSLNDNVFNGEVVRIQPITENGFNTVECHKIERVASSALGNEYQRRSELKKFYTSIDSSLQLLKQGRAKRNGSVIFKILSEELNHLNKSKADKKILIINSDLMENSFIDFTTSSNIERIRNNPNEIEKLLTDKYPVADLKGISIYIIYKPVNKWDSERFEIVSDFYKNLFESKGAIVNVSGNLN